MKIKRHATRVVKIGGVKIGGTHPVAIQSMTKHKTADTQATISQIARLAAAGCEIVRVAVKDRADALAIKAIKPHATIPIVADIHFHADLAIAAIESGADKIRLNPGNIDNDKDIVRVVDALKSARIPLRIGVNSGSVKHASTRKPMADQLVSAALAYLKKIEKRSFRDVVISLKASTVLDTIAAYQKISRVCDYPLHLGVTATGAPRQGAIKSSIACGALLAEGIGDTLRISLTDEPEEEIFVARAILTSLGLRSFGPEIISCPTCGRCEVDLKGIVKDLEQRLRATPARQGFSGGSYEPGARSPKLAVMGCVVNGPGEAKEADIGIAFGKHEGMLFKHGKQIRKVSLSECVSTLIRELEA